ncbi:hypothetical protein [Rubricoccus marinus]|uniref:Uncharacterized protein n=1 Tax=Rubricoccus marinus TaxID=716817 RepID=A0A259TZ58_9BACT|nr:hypothetical protein [Rubricoccus marinus]OZC02887.1 hypothetical protein BSZ36_07825 [Rubricoccus marinus]
MEPRRNLISRKKPTYPVSDYLADYLGSYGRLATDSRASGARGVTYDDLMRFAGQIPLYDELGGDTLWSTVYYGPSEQAEIHDALRATYALLKSDGDLSTVEHLYIDRVDLCHYGNTLPLRVRIVNRLNENFDYFYVKRADANRVYGLDLEHVLSPNRINFYVRIDGPSVREQTLVEEHVVGLPGDAFIRDALPSGRFDQVRLAKEFVKFNERCFVRLLGDMHAGNWVMDVTPDFEKLHYRMRPIDFDQQSHHPTRRVYLPQFFPQNNAVIAFGLKHLTETTVDQYQREERALIAGRLRVSQARYRALMDVMREDLISDPSNVRELGAALARHYHDDAFTQALTMGDLVYHSLELLQKRAEPASLKLLSGATVGDVAGDVRI